MVQVIDKNKFIDADGKQNDGKLVRHFRRGILQWYNTGEIVELFNEALDEEMSVRSWQRLEQNNDVPTDPARRLVIACILDIPVAYLGLDIAEATFTSNIIKLPIPTKRAVNIAAYDQHLKDLWASPYGNMRESLLLLYALQEALLYGKTAQRDQVSCLLCQYLILTAKIQWSEGHIVSAITYLDKAIQFAGEKHYNELLAKAYYLRACCLHDRWMTSLDQEKDYHYLLHARDDAYRAKLVIEQNDKLSCTPLQAAILLDWGRYSAHTTQGDKQTENLVLETVDYAEGLVKAQDFKTDPYFSRIDKDWGIITRAQTYLALGWSKDAIDTYGKLPQGNPQKQRRFVTSRIAEAEAYALYGQIEMSIAYALDALDVSVVINAQNHTARIHCLYTTLRRNEKYRKQPDVVRLGLALLKVEQPQLFVQ